MRFFTRGRYINFFGEREARLSITHSVFNAGDEKKRTRLTRFVSVLMFFTPEFYLKGLDGVYTDHIICWHRWTKFIEKTRDEWRDLIWVGTVLLAANVAFLAIPSVDSSGNGSNPPSGYVSAYPRNPAQVASFVSVIFTVGCMTIGQLLLRHSMVGPGGSAEEVDGYLRSYLHKHHGLKILAILYSLPQALLFWAIASFFLAFFFVTLIASEGKWQRLTAAVVMFLFMALALWCVWMTWAGRTACVERVRRILRCPSSHTGHRTTPQEHPQLQSIGISGQPGCAPGSSRHA